MTERTILYIEITPTIPILRHLWQAVRLAMYVCAIPAANYWLMGNSGAVNLIGALVGLLALAVSVKAELDRSENRRKQFSSQADAAEWVRNWSE